jgi:hypothetical protein
MKEEYRPQPSKQSEQHKPQQEGGNGAPGIQPTLNERAKPPPESPASGGHYSTSVQRPLERRGAVFDCVIPEITIPPVHLRLMLRRGSITEEYAQEAEQEWREELKTWDRQRLEKEVRVLEKDRDDASHSKKQEIVQDVEYQLVVLKEELWQRRAD